MKAVVDTLFEISLYAAVIAGGILLFRRLFQKSMTPNFQYLVWFLLIARLLLPLTLESGFHIESLFPRAATAQTFGVPVPSAAPSAMPQSLPQPGDEQAVPPVTTDLEEAGKGLRPLDVDWYALVAIVWVCGAAAFSLWLLAVKLRFYRRMERCRVETPPEAALLYEKCRTVAGTKQEMPLWVVEEPISPGIALFCGPVLLLPTSILHDKEALRFALLHELAHQRRGDHFVNGLLNALTAVYWFHPVVHYSFSQMRADMEIACDRAVTKLLEPSEKKNYLAAVLNAFSCEVRPQLGMAQFRTSRMAKRRMKGAFMKTNTSLGSKFAAGLLTVFFIAACFTTACQSAPPKPEIEAQTAQPQMGSEVTPVSSNAPSQLQTTKGPAMSETTPPESAAAVLPTPMPTPALSSEESEEAESNIIKLQKRLAELGYAAQISGYYDEQTANAVAAFQKHNGLNADGYAGGITLTLLFSDAAMASNEGQLSPEIFAELIENAMDDIIGSFAAALGNQGQQYASVANISEMLAYAKAAVGSSYELGAQGPKRFDDAGLVYYCLKMAGSDRPPLTVALYAAESDWEDISDIDALKEGDFVFFYGTDNAEVAHMGIVVDDTYMIDASSSEGKVVKREYKTRYWEEHFAGGKRPW